MIAGTVCRAIVLALGTLFLSLTSVHAATFSPKRGINLDLWATWPAEAQWSRKDVLLPFPQWRRTVGLDTLTALRDTGFDFVRMPIDPLPFLSPQSAELKQELLHSVREGTRLINAAGLKVIVDLHPVPGNPNRFAGTEEILRDAPLFDRYVDLVRDIGRTLAAENPERVAFELMNEPVIGCLGEDARQWSDQLARLFAAARASAPRLTLVLGGACWGSAEGLVAVNPKSIPDDNVLWGFHSYEPSILTTQGALWAGDFIRYVTGIPYPPYAHPEELTKAREKARQAILHEAPISRRASMLRYLEEQIDLVDTKLELEARMSAPFRAVADWASKNEIDPRNILLGEFGMIRQEYGNSFVMPPEWRTGYVRDMIALAEERHFAWSVWGFGGAFGIVEEFDRRKADDGILTIIRALDER